MECPISENFKALGYSKFLLHFCICLLCNCLTLSVDLLAVNLAYPILNEQQLHRVKVLCKLPDSRRNVLKLLTYQNVVNYEIIPIGSSLVSSRAIKGKH